VIYTPNRPRVFIDADVLFAGSASSIEHGASLVLLRMAEITLIHAVTSEQVITEVERNLNAKLPTTLPTFHLLVNRCLDVVANPPASDLTSFTGLADPKDLPILVAAKQKDCPWLVTFNIRHFQPGISDVTVLRPGVFVQRVRHLLARM
jgi:predicted nucleic acid-binding protein